MQEEAGDGDAGGEAPLDAGLPRVSLNHVLRIPPHYHIVDKVTQGLLRSFTLTWPRVKQC